MHYLGIKILRALFVMWYAYKCLNHALFRLGFNKMISKELKNWEMVVGFWFLVHWGHMFSGCTDYKPIKGPVL